MRGVEGLQRVTPALGVDVARIAGTKLLPREAGVRGDGWFSDTSGHGCARLILQPMMRRRGLQDDESDSDEGDAAARSV